jgi:hypothetical protein
VRLLQLMSVVAALVQHARLLPTRTPQKPPAVLAAFCFPILQVESSVRLLQLVSVVAEAAGERLQPHLGALAAALPQVRMGLLSVGWQKVCTSTDGSVIARSE